MSLFNNWLRRCSDLISDLVCDKDCDSESFTATAVRDADRQLWNLSKGKDANYLLPGIGRLYSSWYHVRRIRTSHFALWKVNEKDHIKSVIDLGCGTGSVAWALAYLGGENQYPHIEQYVGVDSSEPMLRWAKLLWQHEQEPKSPRKNFATNWIKSDFLNAMRFGEFGSIESDSCDLLILSHLLDNQSKKKLESNTNMLKEIISFLNPKAVICISTRDKTWGIGKLITDISGFKPQEYPMEYGGQCQTDMHVARELLFKELGLSLGGGYPADGLGPRDSRVIISNRNYESDFNTRNNNRCVYKLAEKFEISNRTLLKHISEQRCENVSDLHFASELKVGLIETLCDDFGKNFNKLKVT